MKEPTMNANNTNQFEYTMDEVLNIQDWQWEEWATSMVEGIAPKHPRLCNRVELIETMKQAVAHVEGQVDWSTTSNKEEREFATRMVAAIVKRVAEYLKLAQLNNN
jgi:hypothetical protein